MMTNEEKIYILLQMTIEMNRQYTRLRHAQWDSVREWIDKELFKLIRGLA